MQIRAYGTALFRHPPPKHILPELPIRPRILDAIRMIRPLALYISLAGALLVAACATPAPRPIPAPEPGAPTLTAFRSERELSEFGDRLAAEVRRHERRMRRNPPPPPAIAPPPPVAQPSPSAPAAAGAESITNVQVQGVDEGGIVKVHGDYLVMLRRGRLFTVRVGGDALDPVAAVDAFGPGIDPSGTWIDEILVSGDNVVVIGYSYGRGGTELGIFRIGGDGSLAHRATYHLRSADYYSATNYASRLIGSRLVFYAPVPVNESDIRKSLPAVRRWGGSEWVRTASAERLYLPAADLSVERGVALHTVASCDLAAAELACESTGLFGPAGRQFYVSPGAVYVWTTHYGGWGAEPREPEPSIVYRMPLDGSAPTGLRVTGHPIDQFSFLESGDGHLNVLTVPDSRGSDFWSADEARGSLALLRVPLASMNDGSRAAPRDAYRLLPAPAGNQRQNRYVGDWLLYGAGAGWGRPEPGERSAFAVRWADGGDPVALALPHGVDRIEALGSDALLVGGDGQALQFTAVRLERSTAVVADRYLRPNASQGETRSHGFFYRADGDGEGVLGIPLRGAASPGYEHLRRGSVSMLFLRNQGLRMREMGELVANPRASDNALCVVSCTDWYGNARPIFLRGRTFALMGYELVEGNVDDGRIRERRRIVYAPRLPPVNVAGDWTFEERIGYRGSRYYCATSGTMRFEQRDTTVSMTYAQTGECDIDGKTMSSAGEGSGGGTVDGPRVTLQVNQCRDEGGVRKANQMQGTIQCVDVLPNGSRTTVSGQWTARRAGS